MVRELFDEDETYKQAFVEKHYIQPYVYNCIYLRWPYKKLSKKPRILFKYKNPIQHGKTPVMKLFRLEQWSWFSRFLLVVQFLDYWNAHSDVILIQII